MQFKNPGRCHNYKLVNNFLPLVYKKSTSRDKAKVLFKDILKSLGESFESLDPENKVINFYNLRLEFIFIKPPRGFKNEKLNLK